MGMVVDSLEIGSNFKLAIILVLNFSSKLWKFQPQKTRSSAI